MLVRFTVGNFCSFDKNQTLSLIAGPTRKHGNRLYKTKDFKVLKFASLFGANASGKSNFIKAMEFAQYILFKGTRFIENKKDAYFRLNPSNKNKPSYFEFEILVDKALYAYGFEMIIAQQKITEEWLVKIEKTQDINIFTRNTETKSYCFNNEYLSEPFETHMKIYLEDFKKVQDKLFLGNIVFDKDNLYKVNKKVKIFRDVFKHLFNLNVSYPNTPVTGYECFSLKNIDHLLSALSSFRTGISNVNRTSITREQAFLGASQEFIKEIDFDIQRMRERKRLSKNNSQGLRFSCNGRLVFVTIDDEDPVYTEITFEHYKAAGINFSLKDESEGTQRLLDLLSLLFNTDKEQKVFIIDEIDRSLHPQLTIHFIKTFLKLAEQRDIQLIISTHESHLFDLKLLRQDEIFLVETNESNASILYPFDRFKERFDKQTEKAYLDGRYGGIPLFDKIFSPFED